MQKVPFILVAGDKEKAAETVSVRARGNKDMGTLSVEDFFKLISEHVQTKA